MTAGQSLPATDGVQAVTAIIQRLWRIKSIAPTGNCNQQPSEAERIACEWLRGELPGKLLPIEFHRELSVVLHQIIPTIATMS